MKHSSYDKKNMQANIAQILNQQSFDLDVLKDLSLEHLIQEISIYHQELIYQNEEMMRHARELEEAKKLYANWYNDAPTPYVIYDMDYRIRSANKAFARMFGLGPRDLEGKSLASFIHPDSQDAFYLKMKKLESNLTIDNIELVISSPNAQVIVSVNSSIYFQGDEKLIRSAFFDVTEKKQIEQEQRRLTTQMNWLFNQSLTGIFFMMLDQPVVWDESADKEKVLDYVFAHQRITKVNQAMLEQYKAHEADFIGSTPNLVFQHDLEQGRRVWRQFFDQGRLHIDTSERRMDGSEMTILGDYICLYDQEGRITGHFGMQIDVTESRMAESQAERYRVELEEENQLIETILDNAPLGIWMSGDQPASIFTNRFFKEKFSLTEEEVKVCRKTDLDALSKVGPQHFEETVTFKDNRVHTLEAIKTKILVDSGGKIGILGIGLDVTERINLHKQLEEKKTQFELAVKGSNDGIWDWDIITNALFLSPIWKAQLGYRDDELVNEFDTFAGRIHPEDKEQIMKMVQRYLLGIILNYDVEFRLLHKNGSYRWIRARGEAIRDQSGKAIRMAGSHTDITEQKENERELRASEERYRNLLENAPFPVFIVNLQNKTLRYFNQRAKTTFGLDNCILGQTYRVLYWSESERENFTELLLQRGALKEVEITINDVKGKPLTVLLSAALVEFENEQAAMIAINDISARKEAEQALRMEKDKYRLLTENISDVIWVLNLDQKRYTYISPSVEELTGYTAEEILNSQDADSWGITVDIMAWSRSLNDDAFAQMNQEGVIESLLNCKINRKIWTESSLKLRLNDEGEKEIIGVSRDIQRRKEAEREVLFLSYHDQLTGLYNRRFYEEELKRIDHEAALPLTLILADVNALKLTNDAFGHQVGDELLKSFAAILKKECRAEDIIARIGGDEFILLLPGTDQTEAIDLIRKIQEEIANFKREKVILSVAFGYGCKNGSQQTMEDVFRQADEAMYHHKLLNGNSVKKSIIDLAMQHLFESNPLEQAHSKRVAELCKETGHALGLNEQLVQELEMLGLMHDIGKVGILEALQGVDKEHRINEPAVFRRHAEIGYQILKSVNGYSLIAEYVLAHHEKVNGEGYPQGLKGNEIPFPAKILQIADTFERMTVSRITVSFSMFGMRCIIYGIRLVKILMKSWFGYFSRRCWVRLGKRLNFKFEMTGSAKVNFTFADPVISQGLFAVEIILLARLSGLADCL